MYLNNVFPVVQEPLGGRAILEEKYQLEQALKLCSLTLLLVVCASYVPRKCNEVAS